MIFTVTADRILLVLGGLIFAASLVLGSNLWRTAARGQYEVVEGICAAEQREIDSIGFSCADPFKNDLLAKIQVGNGQRYRLAAPAVLHQAGDILAGGFAVAVHLSRILRRRTKGNWLHWYFMY